MAGRLGRLLAACAAASVVMVSGCGQSEQDPPPEPPGEPSEARQEGPAAPVRTAAAREDEVTVGGELLSPRAADAPRAEPEAPNAFEYVRYNVDSTGEAPAICLAFTAPLDPETDYAPYIAVTPETPIAVSAEGSRLCVGGLTFSSQREITLRAGLPAADGRALERDETTPIDFGDRPSFVGFAGSGVILPRVDADGVGVETVNVDAVRVRVWQVTDRALAFRTITTGYAAASGEYEWMSYDAEPYDVGEMIWEGQMDTAGEANAPVVTVFPIAEAIGELTPGAYFLELDEVSESGEVDGAENERARARRWLLITDLALTTYAGGDGMDVMVRSLQDARPVADVTVQVIARGNAILGESETDARGRARFDAPLLAGDRGMAPRLITAYDANGDFAVLDLDRAPVDLSNNDISGRAPPGEADAYVYLDRGIYRPGETVRASALIRDAAAFAAEERSGSLVVFGPNGIEAGRQRFDAEAFAGAAFYDYDVPRAAARGTWRLSVELDGVGAVGGTTFEVEDFVPQRIALELEADDETPIAADEVRAIQAEVRFLYGAPGAGLPIEGEARLQIDPNPFEDYAGFRFGVHDESFREATFGLGEAVADGAGRAALAIDPAAADAVSSRPMRVRAVVTALEPGGRPVSDDVRIPYRPNERYLGLRPRFDGAAERNQSAVFDVVAVDRNGAPSQADLTWRLTRIDYHYDWYREAGGRWRWRRSREVVFIEDGVATTDANGRADFGTRELDWGSYVLSVEDAASGATASASFWAGWGYGAQEGDEAPDRVRVSGPDAAPAVGDEVEIAILAPYAGEAEVVIANEGLVETRAISVPQEGATVSFTVTEEWGPGAYVMVNVFTPRDAVSQPRPRRAVGVAHIPVNLDARTFALAIEAPTVARPRGPLTVELSAASGPTSEEAYVTLAAVDEGILLLTGFQSPDPTDWFYGRRRLGVELRDDYGRLLDPNQGAAAPVRAGGDQIGGAGLTVVPTRTVALFSGPVRMENGRARITLDVPDFNGELRLMAVAWSESGLGAAATPVTVRDSVPAELIMPRFLAPGDEAVLTATLDNVEGAAGPYLTTVSADDPLSILEGGALTLELAEGQRLDASVRLRADAESISRIALAVEGPEDFSVSRDYPIQIRSPYLPASVVERGRLAAGDRYTPPGDLASIFAPGSDVTTVSFSPTPLDARALYESLSRYPYGCTEQITSRAMPLLYAAQIASLSGVAAEEESTVRMREAIETLLARQSADGAIGLWRVGDRGASPWLGAYATDFLARAQAEGFGVPEAALVRAYDALDAIAGQNLTYAVGYDAAVRTSEWNPDTRERMALRSAAYAFYVLARVGRADRARLRYMHDEQLTRIESPLARAHLGAALAFIGDRARARSAFAAAEEAIGYNNDGDYYQTERRDLAGVLALAAEAQEAAFVERLAERVANELPEPDRLTTQEKAFLLLAAHALAGSGDSLSISADEAAVPAGVSSYVLDRETLLAGATFTNEGLNPIWRTTVARGAPMSAPPPADEGLAVVKEVLTMNGRPAKLDQAVQGDRFIVTLSVFARERRRVPAIIVDLLPAGFEIEAVLRPEDGGATGAYGEITGDISRPLIAEARDDRFVAAVDLFDQEPEVLAYVVRAVTPGSYAMPGAVVEDMYRPDVFGRSAATRVVIASRD